MMKKILSLLFACLPITMTAQSEGQYLEGAVPVVDGKVIFTTEMNIESMNKEQHELELVCDCFKHHLQILSALQPEMWPPDSVTVRLQDAQPRLQRAYNDFEEAYALGSKYRHTDVLQNKPGEETIRCFTWKNLKEEMARGLAFHLPLFVLILISWATYILITN